MLYELQVDGGEGGFRCQERGLSRIATALLVGNGHNVPTEEFYEVNDFPLEAPACTSTLALWLAPHQDLTPQQACPIQQRSPSGTSMLSFIMIGDT